MVELSQLVNIDTHLSWAQASYMYIYIYTLKAAEFWSCMAYVAVPVCP